MDMQIRRGVHEIVYLCFRALVVISGIAFGLNDSAISKA